MPSTSVTVYSATSMEALVESRSTLLLRINHVGGSVALHWFGG